MEHSIKTENYDKINLSEYEGGLWLSIWKAGAYCSAHLNQDQLRNFYKAVGEYIKETTDEL